MPSLPVIPNAFLIFQQLVGTNARAQMGTRHCVIAPSSTAPATVAGTFAAAYSAHLLYNLCSSISMGDTEVTPLDGVSPVQSFATSSFGHTGGDSGVPLPYNNNITITWRTGTRGRSHRGRTFLPGINPANLSAADGHLLSSSAQGVFAGDAAAFLSTLATGAPALTLEVLSLKLGATTTVVSASCNPSLTVQRRRLEKVARH
jgi:hypothetical protein